MLSIRKRIFIAIPLSEYLLQQLQTIQERLQNTYENSIPSFRLTPIKNLHITVFFAGEIGTAFVPELIQKVEDITKKSSTFFLDFEEIKAAPSKEPRMIWAQYKNNPAFNELVSNMRTGLRAFSENQFEHEKTTPHITLARFAPGTKINHKELPMAELDRLIASHTHVFESSLGGPHPLYIQLATNKLSDSSQSST